jgi:hypothetical protein
LRPSLNWPIVGRQILDRGEGAAADVSRVMILMSISTMCSPAADLETSASTSFADLHVRERQGVGNGLYYLQHR